jgi:hypothetical protein
MRAGQDDHADHGREDTTVKTRTNTFTALPIVLAHTEQIRVEAMIMSITGGLLIYGTIISFTMFFREQEEF